MDKVSAPLPSPSRRLGPFNAAERLAAVGVLGAQKPDPGQYSTDPTAGQDAAARDTTGAAEVDDQLKSQLEDPFGDDSKVSSDNDDERLPPPQGDKHISVTRDVGVKGSSYDEHVSPSPGTHPHDGGDDAVTSGASSVVPPNGKDAASGLTNPNTARSIVFVQGESTTVPSVSKASWLQGGDGGTGSVSSGSLSHEQTGDTTSDDQGSEGGLYTAPIARTFEVIGSRSVSLRDVSSGASSGKLQKRQGPPPIPPRRKPGVNAKGSTKRVGAGSTSKFAQS
ncbi:hypothetical protein QFC21_004379 [Naganishia friedmannii]|uniref:Uncharacterized protein n=1 Tax=Naganishia friedmannii TaxID=89922 RepID=A0ACC2VIU2_9TREE|nr:hypothetical protein QFC21_004379 [Naganishia friedmannii]